MSGGAAPKVDLAQVIAEGSAGSLLRQAAEIHAAPLYVADGAGRVLAAFAPAAWKGAAPAAIPVESGAAAARGLALRPVEVYDAVCGYVAAAAPGGPGEAAARFAADLVAALGARQHETESLSRSLLDTFEEVNLFYGITALLHRVGGADGICRTILARACEIVKAARASILLADPHTGVMRIVASQGIPEEQVARIRVQPGEGVVGRVMDTGQAVIVDDAGTREGTPGGVGRYASRSFISVPVRVFDPDELSGARRTGMHRRSLGVLNMTDKAGGGPFTSGDLKLLSALSSQAAVLLDNTRLAGIEKEMGLARTIQASLLPQAPPVVAGAELAGVCTPARNVGGDYFDMLALPGGKAAVLVADVSGHNVGAALMMAVSRAAIRAEIDRAEEPDEILARVNRLLDADLGRSELFVSVFLAVYDPGAGILSYASAGHNPAMLLRARGGPVEELDAEGILLGVLPEYGFDRRTVRMAPGDLVLLFTDGLTEARDVHGEMFGEARLAGALERASGLPTGEIPAALLASIDAFTGTAPSDDRTVAVLRAVTMPPPGGTAGGGPAG